MVTLIVPQVLSFLTSDEYTSAYQSSWKRSQSTYMNDEDIAKAVFGDMCPHGLPYDVLHKGIVVAIYPQVQPVFHPAFDVASSDHARTLTQDTRGKDQGAFGVPLPLTNAREFPCHR